LFFIKNQISGAVGYPSINSNADAGSLGNYFHKSFGSSVSTNLNRLKTDLEEISGINERTGSDEPYYDYDDDGESTDEILSRLLKEHELRITYKLLTEKFVGDDSDPDESGYSSSQSLLRNTLEQNQAKTKRMEGEKINQKIIKDKKDMESWLHQADPSLTVNELPAEPQISFRKKVRVNKNDNNVKKPNDENPKDVLSPRRRGMKEEVMERPAIEGNPHFFPLSPFAKFPYEE
jgi:hypothetical protein